MNIVANSEPRILSLQVTKDELIAQLADGRRISVPLAWSWRLADATPEQRAKFELLGNGQGVTWPELDEDISAWGMLYGIPARRPALKTSRPLRKARSLRKRARVAA
jgi:hypothetical protein